MGDFGNETYSDPFIEKLVKFVAGNVFQTKFENFFLTHAPKFSQEVLFTLFIN